jgi:hypothetical protein
MLNNLEWEMERKENVEAYQWILLWISNTWIFYACKFLFFFPFLNRVKVSASQSIDINSVSTSKFQHTLLSKEFLKTSFFPSSYCLLTFNIIQEYKKKVSEKKTLNCWTQEKKEKKMTEKKKCLKKFEFQKN